MDIDLVFWIQVKAAWSQDCDVNYAEPDKIIRDAPPKDLVALMTSLKL